MLEGVGLGKRDGAPAVLVAVEQPLHALLGAVLPVEVLHLRNRQFNRVPRRESEKRAKSCWGLSADGECLPRWGGSC